MLTADHFILVRVDKLSLFNIYLGDSFYIEYDTYKLGQHHINRIFEEMNNHRSQIDKALDKAVHDAEIEGIINDAII